MILVRWLTLLLLVPLTGSFDVSSGPALAETTADTIPEMDVELLAPLTALDVVDGEHRGAIAMGTDTGVVRGERLALYRTSDGSLEEIGYAVIDSLGAESVTLFVYPTEVAAAAVGDAVEMRARVRWPAAGMLSLEIARYALTLTDAALNPLFDPAKLLAAPDTVTDAAVLEILAQAVVDHAAELQGNEVALQTISEGRFQDLTLLAAMEQTEPQHLRDFLLYVRSYPGKYVGQTFRVGETFAGWMYSGAPISGWEVIDRFPALGDDERRTFLASHRDALMEDDAVETWYKESRRLWLNGQQDQAEAILEIMRVACERYAVTSWCNFYWAAAGDINSWAGRNEAAYEAQTQAIATAENDSIDLAAGHHNRGTILEDLERYREAIADYETALRYKGAWDDPFANPASASSLMGLGRCFHELLEYETAVQYLRTAVDVLATDGDLESVEWSAGAYSRLGDVYESMGRYGLAVEAWRQGLAAAEKLGWKDTMATALQDVSDGYWNLGELRNAVNFRERALALRRETADAVNEAHTLVNLAELLWQLGEMPAARDAFDAALVIYTERDRPWDVGDTHRRLGGHERERGDHEAAFAHLAQALEIFEREQSIADIAATRLELAETMVLQGRLAEADASYQRSLDAFREVDDRVEQARVLLWWGVTLAENRQPIAARERLDEALVHYEAIDDLAGQTDCQREISNLVATHEGDMPRALRAARAALEIAEAMPSKAKIADALIALGQRLMTSGQVDEAFTHQQRALALYEEMEDQPGIASAHLALGGLYQARGEYELSMVCNRTAVDIAETGDLPGTRAWALGQIAWQLYTEGKAEEAKQIAYNALAIQDTLGAERASSATYNTLASIASFEGKMDEALRLFGQAQTIDEKWHDLPGQAAGLNNVGQVYHGLGDYESAASYYEQALVIEERVDYTEAAVATIGNLAECYHDLGRHDEAFGLLDRGLAMATEAGYTPRVIELRTALGRMQRELHRYDEARATLVQALEAARGLGKTLSILRIRRELGIAAWNAGEFDTARDELLAVVAEARTLHAPMISAEALLYLGRTRRDLHDNEGAIAAYREAIDNLEQVRRGLADQTTQAAFQAQHAEAYSELIDLLESLGRHEEAWKIISLMKSQEMQDMRTAPGVDAYDEDERQARDTVESFHSREILLMRKLQEELDKPLARQREDLIVEWEAAIDSVVNAYEAFVDTLKLKQSELYERLEIEPVTFYQLQGSLAENEAFIEPVILPDRVVVFVVRGGYDPLLVRETPVAEAQVDSLIREMRWSLAESGITWENRRAELAMPIPLAEESDPTAAARELYRLLIEPVLGDLHRIETLIVSPSGRLRYIPFAALYDGERYLIDRFRTCVLNKAGIVTQRTAIPADASLLACGDPDSSLSGAEHEVQRLAQIWDSSRLETYFGEQVTQRLLRRTLGRYDIMHLATHGTLLEGNPKGSFLRLGGTGTDSSLTFSEIDVLPLRDLELAVLSACQTALGENGDGKEIAGLAYNFQKKGTATVVATLWSVDDVSTADLMVKMYEALATGEISRLDALHSAQLALRNSTEFSHPYHWAPFILIGNWR